jgi:NADH-quinone oxidoreductase subunit A
MVLVILFAGGSVVMSRALSPRRATGAKEGPYESGIVPRYSPSSRFPVRFFLVAMIFIIFDIEVVFLYPWAVMYHQLAAFGFLEMGVFAVVVFVAFSYLVAHGALDWGPRQRRGRSAPARLGISTTATVVRVPRPIELVDGFEPRPVGEEPEDEDAPSWAAPVSEAKTA